MTQYEETMNRVLVAMSQGDFVQANSGIVKLKDSICAGQLIRADLEPKIGIAESSLLMNQNNFKQALLVIRESLPFAVNNYELYYCAALCLEKIGEVEDAYFHYKFAIYLGRDSEDIQVLQDAFSNLCSYADAAEYQLGKSCQKLIESRLVLKEYATTADFLKELLFDSNQVAAKTVLSEDNMLLYMMLEIVLCEQKSMDSELFLKDNTSIRYQNDVAKFKTAYSEIKLMVRRIWFGLSVKKQSAIKRVIRRYPVSADMLAVIAKYSVIEAVWQDVFLRLYEILKDSFPEIAKGILRYQQWLATTGVGGASKCAMPLEYDNQAEVRRIDCKDDTITENIKQQDATKISIIYCTNDELYSKECMEYIHQLIIPQKMTLEVLQVWNASGMASGYNKAMSCSNAVYKIYIHQDTFLIHRNVLVDIVSAFQENQELGALGIAGNIHLNKNGLWWKGSKTDLRMVLYQDAVLNILESMSVEKKGSVEYADALDGILIATSADIRWREDLFDGWHFYDISQCFEVKMHGKKVGLLNAEKMWVLHETTMKKDPLDLYEKYRQIFIQNYMEELPILVYRGAEVCYGVLNSFADCLTNVLRNAGERVEVYDIEKEDIRGITRYVGRRFKAVLGIQTYVMSIYLESQKKYLHDLIEGPKYNFILDHPIWMKEHLDIKLKNHYVLTLDEHYAEFVKQYYRGVKDAHVLMPGGISAMQEQTDKSYAISFVGTYSDYRNYLAVIAKMEGDRFVANRMLLYLKQQPSLTAKQALERTLEHYEIECDDNEFLQWFSKMKVVVFCIMSYYREKVIDILTMKNYGGEHTEQQTPEQSMSQEWMLHVFGDSWNQYRCKDNLCVHSQVSVAESLDIMQQSQISLNIMAWHKDGFTERIANAMMNDSVVLTDRSGYIEKNLSYSCNGEMLTEEVQIVEYDLAKLDKLPEIVDKLIHNTELCRKIAQNAKEEAQKNHTWEQSAKEFLRIIDGDKDQI